MRFFLLLVAAFVALLAGKQTYKEFPLPKGLPDGSVLTIYFKHNDWEFITTSAGPVHLYFYDQDDKRTENSVSIPDNTPAYLRLERNWKYNVYSNTRINDHWNKEEVREQPNDDYPPLKGYWRLDIVKVEAYRLNIFFQGFWSDMRTFYLPLMNLKRFGFRSDYVEFDTIQVHHRFANADLVPLTYDQFKDFLYGDTVVPRKLTTLPGLPLNGTIEMAAVLRAKAGGDRRKPMLVFQPVDGSSYFLKFHQEWTGETHQAFLGTNEGLDNGADHPKSTQCTRDWMKPNGDLVHFKLTRIRYNVVEVRVLYKYDVVNIYRTNYEVYCWMWINKDLAAVMDRPFNIMSHDSALLLHVQRSYPDVFPPSSAEEIKFYTVSRCQCSNAECQICENHLVPYWNKRTQSVHYSEMGDNCVHKGRFLFWGGC